MLQYPKLHSNLWAPHQNMVEAWEVYLCELQDDHSSPCDKINNRDSSRSIKVTVQKI